MTRRQPRPGEVHLWWIDLNRPDFDEYVLSDEERCRAAAFRLQQARRFFIRRRVALRQILSSYLLVPPRDVPLGAGPLGKPEIMSTRNGPRFNASSSGSVACVALCSSGLIGVDLEARGDGHPVPPARLFASTREQASLAAAPEGERHRQTLELWTMKEAVAKASGVGVSDGLEALEITGSRVAPELSLSGSWAAFAGLPWIVRVVASTEEHVGAVAVAGEWRTTVCRNWPYRNGIPHGEALPR